MIKIAICDDEKYFVDTVEKMLKIYAEKNGKDFCIKKYTAINPDKSFVPEKLGYINKDSQGQRIYSVDGKSVCLSALGGGWGSKTGLYAVCGAMRGRHIVDGKRQDIKGAKTDQRFEIRDDKKTNCLTSVQKDNYIIQRSRGFNKGGVFEDKCPTLSSNSWEHNNILSDGYRICRLTPVECERLQTLPDNYTQGVSDSQRYKMLGNGWTRDVIEHNFNCLKNPVRKITEFQPDMFGFSDMGVKK